MMWDDLQVKQMYCGVQTHDVRARRKFLEKLPEIIRDFSLSEEWSGVCNGNNNSSVSRSMERHVPILLRLACDCPFKDVRDCCSDILYKLQLKGSCIPHRRHPGPSMFISNKDCIPISTDDDDVHQLFADAFVSTGRVPHHVQLMGYHAQYLSWFLQLEAHLLHSDGPLPFDWRYYLGILGASRHACGILIHECEQMFLLTGGNPTWLNGLRNVPTKLAKIVRLNNVLAHRPWLVSQDIVQDLLCGSASETWTVSELIQAICILVHFQSLSSFVYGCGITPELDMASGYFFGTPQSSPGGTNSEPTSPTRAKARSPHLNFGEVDTTAELYEKIQKVQQEATDMEEQEGQSLRQFQEVESTELDESFDESIVGGGVACHDYDKYIEHKDFHYVEFAKRDKREVDVLRGQDCSWQEHCFSFINRLYPGVGTLLEEKFNCSYNLTYYTMGDMSNVDTSKFRLATWNYIHLIYGICHDDYVYYEVNKLLERSYKMYIKKVACFPERITYQDFLGFYTGLQPSEKVHINLLVLESRLQAALLYALRAVMKYQNG